MRSEIDELFDDIAKLGELGTFGDDELGTFGAGEEGGVSVPNPIGIDNDKYNFDYYAATAALHLFSMIDPEQYKNIEDVSNKIATRAKTFANKIRSTFPGAFV